MRHYFLWFTALFPLLLISCDDDPVEPEPDDDEALVFYWKATVDGSTVSYETGVDDHLIVYDISSDEFSDGDSINIGPGAAVSSPAYYENGFGEVDFIGYKFNKTAYEADKAAALTSLFVLGNHPYIETFFPDSPGISVRRDINDEQWISLYEEQPESSTFTVTESVASSAFGMPTRRVKGTFNCLIFNSDGDSKVVEDGTFFLEFQAP